MKHTKFRFSDEKLDYSCSLMRALAHPLRLRILQYIDEAGTTNVNSIYNTLRIEQSITSQHLKILRTAGVVTSSREGKMVLYTINYSVVEKAHRAVKTFISTSEKALV